VGVTPEQGGGLVAAQEQTVAGISVGISKWTSAIHEPVLRVIGINVHHLALPQLNTPQLLAYFDFAEI
jgi:hypothetical protein